MGKEYFPSYTELPRSVTAEDSKGEKQNDFIDPDFLLFLCLDLMSCLGLGQPQEPWGLLHGFQSPVSCCPQGKSYLQDSFFHG